MSLLPSKNTAWKLTKPPNSSQKTSERSRFRHSTTSSRLGAVPVTSHTTSPTPAVSGRIRSQNGAISVEWYGEGSGSL